MAATGEQTEVSRDSRSAAGNPIPDREQPRTKQVFMLVGLAALGHLARDRRFQLNVVVLAVGLAAATGLARKSGANGFARLKAWDQRQVSRATTTGRG